MMFFTQSGKDKKQKQQQLVQKYLQKATTALELLSKVYEPTTIYTKLWYYTQSKDENIKQPFRAAVEQIFARMNKKESLIKNLKEIIRKQKMYNQAIMEKLDPVYHYEEKDLVRNSDLLERIGKVSRKDQESYMKGWKIDPTLQRFFVEFNRVKRKYDLLMRAIKSYRRSANPHFQAGIQKLNEDFQNQQVSQILAFDDQLNRSFSLKIKDMVTSQKITDSLKIIYEALNQIQKARDFMQLDRILQKYKSQMVNYKLFELFIRNEKERIKLHTILKNLKRFMTDDISEIQQIFVQIDCDVDLNPYYKVITHEIVGRLLEMRKCQVLFSKYSIKMNFKSVSSLFDYFEQMASVVKQSLQEIQAQHLSKNESQKFSIYKIPPLPNGQTNIFFLMMYFKKLLEYVKSPLNSNNQSNNNIEVEIGSVSIQEAIEEKNKLCQTLKQRLEIEENKNKLLNKHVHRLNTQLKKIKTGEQEKNEEVFRSFGSQEEIENKQDDERETEKMFTMRKQHQKEVRSLEQKIKQLQQKNVKKSKLLQQYQHNAKDLKKCGMEEQERKSILLKLKQLQQEKQNYEITKVEADKKISEIKEQDTFTIRQLQRKVEGLQKILQNSQRDREQLKYKFDQCQSQNQQKLDKLNQQLSYAKAMYDKLVSQINLIQAQKATLAEQVRQKEEHLEKLVKQNQKLNAQNQKLNADVVELGDRLQKMQHQFEQQGQQNKNLSYKLEHLEQQQSRILTLKNKAQKTLKTTLILHGPILTSSSNNQTLKNHLLCEIQKISQSNIKQTSLIYKIDNKNKTNPHEYIDNISNWVAMWELKTGYIVGAYCPSSYQSGGTVKEGFMFSYNCKLNQIKVYRLLGKNQKARIYTYENYYFTIGNSEIRYKFLEMNLVTFFGSNYRYFDTGKQKTIDFFGSQQSQIQLVQFEFHSIKFE